MRRIAQARLRSFIPKISSRNRCVYLREIIVAVDAFCATSTSRRMSKVDNADVAIDIAYNIPENVTESESSEQHLFVESVLRVLYKGVRGGTLATTRTIESIFHTAFQTICNV